MSKTLAMLFAVFIGVFLPTAGLCAPATVAEQVETQSWQDEFERICAQTEIAASLSTEQLQKLVSESDDLLDRLARVEDRRGKVYIFRLRNCRAFFLYTLELRELEN